ncbi:pentapeptide repeat-containing protein, partial [Planktothrix agardhii]
WANLSQTDLRDADLRDASLLGANLENTQFQGAQLPQSLKLYLDLAMTCSNLYQAHTQKCDLELG